MKPHTLFNIKPPEVLRKSMLRFTVAQYLYSIVYQEANCQYYKTGSSALEECATFLLTEIDRQCQSQVGCVIAQCLTSGWTRTFASTI